MLRESVRAVEMNQHVFGALGRNPYLHHLFGHGPYTVLTQLGTYPAKQTEFLLRGMAEDPGLVARYLSYSGILQRMAADTMGISLSGSIGLGYLDTWMNPPQGRLYPLSVIPQTIVSGFALMNAQNRGDPQEIKVAADRFHRNLNVMEGDFHRVDRWMRQTNQRMNKELSV